MRTCQDAENHYKVEHERDRLRMNTRLRVA